MVPCNPHRLAGQHETVDASLDTASQCKCCVSPHLSSTKRAQKGPPVIWIRAPRSCRIAKAAPRFLAAPAFRIGLKAYSKALEAVPDGCSRPGSRKLPCCCCCHVASTLRSANKTVTQSIPRPESRAQPPRGCAPPMSHVVLGVAKGHTT